jgi:hypothetical protein
LARNEGGLLVVGFLNPPFLLLNSSLFGLFSFGGLSGFLPFLFRIGKTYTVAFES